jgi:predicted TIM-barrel fold metal-dependent hydrolase
MKIVSIEEHFLTRSIHAAWDASPIGAEGTDLLDHGEMRRMLEDLGDGRLALMDESGIDVQVLSVTTPALHNLESAESIQLARETNDLIAATIAKYPTRFQGFAVLPMAAPPEAALELQRTVEHHPDFIPLLRTASEQRVPLFIHPQIPQASVRADLYSGFGELVDLAFATFGLGWHYEAGIQFVRLILAGVFDRFPDLQIILGHWGEVVLFYLERLNTLARVAKLERPVEAYFRQNLYVTPSGMWNHEYLKRAVNVVGQERILFSSDYPYQYRPGKPGRSFLLSADLSQEAKKRLRMATGKNSRIVDLPTLKTRRYKDACV